MKKTKLLALGLCVVLVFSACGQRFRVEPLGESLNSEPSPEVSAVLETSSDSNSPLEDPLAVAGVNLNFYGLSAEERMADYEQFWTILREDYPYLPMIERSGLDLDELYESGKRYLSEENQTDHGLLIIINSICERLGNAGHLGFLSYEDWLEYKRIYGSVGGREVWSNLLENPSSAEQYPKLAKAMDEIGAAQRQLYDEAGEEAGEEGGQEGGNWSGMPEGPPHLGLQLFDEARIAYLPIHSFSYEKVEEDGAILSNIYQQIEAQGYEDLLIDLRLNGGGANQYYEENIVRPNIKKSLLVHSMFLVNDAANNKPFNQEALEGDGQNREVLDFQDLLSLPELNPDDLRQVSKAYVFTKKLKPKKGSPLFTGRIWLWIGERVYSASDAFASLCKETNFAKLIGENSGGDGVGFDPVLALLPASGIVVRYSSTLSLNLDGSNNEEVGTSPDFPLASDASLKAALALIEDRRGDFEKSETATRSTLPVEKETRSIKTVILAQP